MFSWTEKSADRSCQSKVEKRSSLIHFLPQFVLTVDAKNSQKHEGEIIFHYSVYLRYIRMYIPHGKALSSRLFDISFSLRAEQTTDSLKTYHLNDVVVTASRLEEDLSKSPVSIEKISAKTFYQSPSPSFFDALENVKGIQIVQAGDKRFNASRIAPRIVSSGSYSVSLTSTFPEK